MANVSERLARICALIPYLRQHSGTRLTQVAQYLGCQPKQVLDDLNAVLMCGVPPYSPTDYINVAIEGDRVYLQFADQFRRPVRLTLLEALALRLAAASLAGSGSAQASDLLRRLDRAMPAPLRVRHMHSDEQFHFSSQPPAQQTKLKQIESAIQERRKLRVDYYTAGRDTMSARTLRPYALVNHAGTWYVAAFCERRHAEAAFRVDRIKTLEPLPHTFQVPDDFDVRRYQRQEMYVRSDRDVKVEIRFSHRLARWIQEEMAGQKIRKEPDGGVRLTLFTHSPEWIVSWLMPYQHHAEVLSPPELRQRMRRACLKIAKTHE